MTKVDFEEVHRDESQSPVSAGDRRTTRDNQLLQDLFDDHGSTVVRYFARRGFPPEDCLDLTQETFLEAMRSWDSYREDASRRTWLFAIMNNVWKQTLRKKNAAKRDAFVVSFEEWVFGGEAEEWEVKTGTGQVGEPLGQVLLRERSEWVRDALTDLPESMRECLLLRLDQGLKYRDIAILLKMPLGSVKSQLFQAREKLRASLAGKMSQYGEASR